MAEPTIVRSGNGLFITGSDGFSILAKITWKPNERYVVCDQTFVDPSLRGQGIAEKLLDAMVDEMKKEDKYILAQCSYVANKFESEPEKYDSINWAKNKDKKN